MRYLARTYSLSLSLCYVMFVCHHSLSLSIWEFTARAHSVRFVPFSFGKYLPMHSRIIIIQIDCVGAQRVCIAVSNIGIPLNEYAFYLIFIYIYILHITANIHGHTHARTQSLTHICPSRTLDSSCVPCRMFALHVWKCAILICLKFAWGKIKICSENYLRKWKRLQQWWQQSNGENDEKPRRRRNNATKCSMVEHSMDNVRIGKCGAIN